MLLNTSQFGLALDLIQSTNSIVSQGQQGHTRGGMLADVSFFQNRLPIFAVCLHYLCR